MRLLGPLIALVVSGCATSTTDRLKLPPLRTVEKVDLGRYLGTWYEIASFPQSFQKGCTASTANYTLRANGEIDVVNRCRKDSLDGPEQVAQVRPSLARQRTGSSGEEPRRDEQNHRAGCMGWAKSAGRSGGDAHGKGRLC